VHFVVALRCDARAFAAKPTHTIGACCAGGFVVARLASSAAVGVGFAVVGDVVVAGRSLAGVVPANTGAAIGIFRAVYVGFIRVLDAIVARCGLAGVS
jgi:hypothetical protein